MRGDENKICCFFNFFLLSYLVFLNPQVSDNLNFSCGLIVFFTCRNMFNCLCM